MIWESCYWKDDLLELADHLERRAAKGRWGERALVRLEKNVFWAFYAVRKLIEGKKLSDRIVAQEVPLLTYAPTGKAVTLMNWHKIDELYELDNATHAKKPLKFLCDQFIHSYVFVPLFDDAGRCLCSIYFSSDRHRHQTLYRLSLAQMIRVLRRVGSDYPRAMEMRFDSAIRDYVVKAK